MSTSEKSKRPLYIGIVGCLLYVLGDFLFAATGRGQATENIGFMVRVAYLDMGTWRMVASILCGFAGTLMYYMGFHRMYGLLKCHVREAGNLKWVRMFRVAYVTGTVAWAYVHAMFMTVALIFKYTCQTYGDMHAAADIANRVFYANAAPMVIAYILCDVLLRSAGFSEVANDSNRATPRIWISRTGPSTPWSATMTITTSPATGSNICWKLCGR